MADDVLWLHIQHTRTLDVPFNRDLFLVYFSFTYGMIEFSYVTAMFQAKSMKAKALWTLFLYGGWMATALISQHVGIDDRTIQTARDMSHARLIQVAMVAGGYLLLLLLKYTWPPMKSLTFLRMIYLFCVGILVHFGMEITLLASGIRPAGDYVHVLVFNSLLEFNMGVPILYILWTAIRSRKPQTKPEKNRRSHRHRPRADQTRAGGRCDPESPTFWQAKSLPRLAYPTLGGSPAGPSIRSVPR